MLYDANGQAPLSLRNVDWRSESPDEEEREAEVGRTGEGADESETPAPTLALFGEDGKVIWRAP